MHQKTKQFQAAKTTLELIANNSDDILAQMETAATTNLDNLQLYFENIIEIYRDIEELSFDSNIDTVLGLRAELTDFLGCFLDNILYYNAHRKIRTMAHPLVEEFETYYSDLENAGEFDVRENLAIIKKYSTQYTELSKTILTSRTKTSIIAVTIYRSLVNVFENFLDNLTASITKDPSIYDIIQYMTILDAIKHYYVDITSGVSFYSTMLATKISKDILEIKAAMEDTSKLDGYNFDIMAANIKTYKIYLLALKDECNL